MFWLSKCKGLKKGCLLDDSSHVRPLLDTVFRSIRAQESYSSSARPPDLDFAAVRCCVVILAALSIGHMIQAIQPGGVVCVEINLMRTALQQL